MLIIAESAVCAHSETRQGQVRLVPEERTVDLMGGSGNVVESETDAPALVRKPSVAATPFTLDRCASPRLDVRSPIVPRGSFPAPGALRRGGAPPRCDNHRNCRPVASGRLRKRCPAITRFRARIMEYLPVELAVREGTTVQPQGGTDRRDFKEGLCRFRDETKAPIDFDNHPSVVSCREAEGSLTTAPDLLDIMQPVLEGMERVHAAVVLHRDIKRSNKEFRKNSEGYSSSSRVEV